MLAISRMVRAWPWFLATFLRAAALQVGIEDEHWATAWTAMPQLTEPANLPQLPYNGTNTIFENATIRQTLRMSAEAQQIRIRVSNAFGGSDLPLTGMSVALPPDNTAGTSAVDPTTIQVVTFSGSRSINVPNGAMAVSDPLNLAVKPGQMISLSLYLENGQSGHDITSHPGSRTTSWFTAGNQMSNTNLTGASLNSTAHWYFISAVEAWVPASASTMVLIGDSITDGRGSTTDGNDRWPDLLLDRMQKQSDAFIHCISIANQAAGGNRILADGLGPNVLARLDRDVLSQSGVNYALIFEGVNDIGVAAADSTNQSMIYQRLISAYDQIVQRAHAHRVPIFAGTITPFSGLNATLQPYSDPLREQTRQQVNAWIRNSGRFDEVIDFDRVLADPNNPSQLNPIYDSGDYLHPNPAGYQAMADAFPLQVFEKYRAGVSGFV